MHDGMSLPKRTGMGCYAKLATIAREVGSDISNVSKSLKRLVEWEYLTEERQSDGRRKAYRVRFDSAEDWRNRQESQQEKVGEAANDSSCGPLSNDAEFVGDGNVLALVKQEKIDAHYISLKGLEPSEEGELDSPEGSLCETGSRKNPSAGIDATMARIHREFRRGAPADVVDACTALLLIMELEYDDTRRLNQAHRLYQDLASTMTDAEARASHKRFAAYLRRVRSTNVVSIDDAAGRRTKCV